ncbi:hypothetical protein CWRG_02502 [Chthonomonas calidirosea]|uniref:Uncharacterized protein n=1 Tax=Chthonomonas calidirosea (strain DSM 23976 / ICMP 18418 / T49) TaxID=1303518 RepID=S0EUN6_CHTCT|nr:hypothetical protein [Chthonomonas calidirosea]CCW35392.1 hypothetical protein CCALI_01576 [Chthonomonas calidirosea T49]CEK19431.1 hypothetical protein CWRG_02502 [Chthonomonas calidirosea]CEK19432.1 hypothetical protein CP488_02520 [Chthonomonas calidirosea]CEK20411.1 hypothetical protein CTKA_02524 [Chthonomonas calidirosea]
MTTEAGHGYQQAQLEDLAKRICGHIQSEWAAFNTQVFYRLHTDKYIDVTVISSLFEGQMGPEREGALWQLLAPFSPQELLHLTGCLLLTPSEAQRLAIERPTSTKGEL